MEIDFTNDTCLKRELEKGNSKALTYLMNVYHHALCLYVYNLSNDYDGAKDIVQDIFLRIWENRNRIQSIQSIKNFLYRSAYNGFIDNWRKDKKILLLEKKHIESLDRVIEDTNENSIKEQILLMKREIEKLPPKSREVFLLSKKEGLTNIEIATFMNISVRTVESHMYKSFKILKKRLKGKIEPILFLLLGYNRNNNTVCF